MIASGPRKKTTYQPTAGKGQPAGIARPGGAAASACRDGAPPVRLPSPPLLTHALLNSVQIRSRDRVPFAETFAETSFFTRFGGGKTSVLL